MAIGGQGGRWPSYGMINTCKKIHQEVSSTIMPLHENKISHASDCQ